MHLLITKNIGIPLVLFRREFAVEESKFKILKKENLTWIQNIFELLTPCKWQALGG